MSERTRALATIAELAARHGLGAGEIAEALERAPVQAPAERSSGILARVLAYLGGIFVLAGIAVEPAGKGMQKVRYQSGTDLLLQTPEFYEKVVKDRLKKKFNRAYRYIEALYDGSNPYMEFIERNIAYLEHIIETGEWDAIRRDPPCFSANEDPLASANALVNVRMNQMRQNATYLGQV